MQEKKNTKKQLGRLWLVMPAFVWLSLFVVIPLVILFVYSFGGRDDLGRVVLKLSLSNYLRFISGPYLITLARSILLSTITTLSALVLGYLFALWLAVVAPKKKRNFLLLLIVLPLWTSSLLRVYAWITLLRPTGILSHLATGFGLHFPSILYTPLAVWIGMVYNYLPYMILPLYTSLEKFDMRLLEAALDLGASPLRILCRVLIPLTGGGIVAGSVMVFIPSLGDYVTPDLLGGAKTMYIGNLIQNQFLTVRDWAFGSAVSSILILIVSAAIWIYLKYADSEAFA
ncbi:MAG: ABC transporter permease [Cyanobacteria bacterium SZAS LIN-3]|nr:ABC transporter permease [Cyanobacteria bacterium SZAS LIN-3]